MPTIGIAKLGVIIKLNENKSVLLSEGDCVTGLRYTYKKREYVLDGCVRVICATTAANNGGPTTCPPEPYTQNYITPTQLIIDSSTDHRAVITKVPIAEIIDIADVQHVHGDEPISIGSGPQYRPIADVLAEVKPGATVNLLGDIFEDPITLSNGVTLICDENTVLEGPVNIVGSGTIVGGKITAPVTLNASPAAAARAATNEQEAEPTILLQDIYFSEKATVTCDGATNITIRDSLFEGHVFDTTRGYVIHVKSENEMQLILEDNTFSAEPEASYNLIECQGKLMTGSSISRNRFEAGCCTHNQINLYNIADDADVVISNNWCAHSANMVRIGFKGAPIGTVTMENNACDTTDHGEWGGLFLIQPYGTKTTSFKGINIHLNDNVVPEGEQIGYLYAQSNEMQFTSETSPTIYLNGEIIEIPDASPVTVPMALR